jgi:hypothetical protein
MLEFLTVRTILTVMGVARSLFRDEKRMTRAVADDFSVQFVFWGDRSGEK